MQVGIDSFAAAFDDNSRAVNPAERLRRAADITEPIAGLVLHYELALQRLEPLARQAWLK